jgi:hypothetical protein
MNSDILPLDVIVCQEVIAYGVRTQDVLSLYVLRLEVLVLSYGDCGDKRTG